MKRVLVIVGVVIIVAALAVAAYLVAQMLTPADDATAEGGRGRNLVMAWDDGNGPTTINIHVQPNPMLPDRPMDASGILTRQEDNSVFVGTGEIQLSLEADGTSEPEVGLSHSGPEIEVDAEVPFLGQPAQGPPDQRSLPHATLRIDEHPLAVFHGADQVRHLLLPVAESLFIHHTAVFEWIDHFAHLE